MTLWAICACELNCREKVVVNQDWITFQGDGPRLTEIQWGDTATSAGSTFKSASVAVNGDYFTAKDISFRVIRIPILLLIDQSIELLTDQLNSQIPI